MAKPIHISNITGGNININTTGGGGSGTPTRDPAVTRFWLSSSRDGEGPAYEDYDVVGTLNDVWMAENGFQENSEGNTTWKKNIVKVEIGEHVDEIGAYAFYDGDKVGDGLDNLAEITIPNTVKAIREEAFMGCTGLTSIVIPDSVTSIGNDAFNDCSAITELTIGNGVKGIGQRAFSGCEALSSLSIGNSVVSIEESAFFGCQALNSITLPATIQYIGDSVFDACNSLTQIEIPGFTMFQVCSNSEYWGLPEDCVATCSNGTYTVGGEKPEVDPKDESEATEEQLTKITVLENGEEETISFNIRGIWTDKWNIDNDFQDPETYQWTKTIKGVVVGTNVTEIGSFAFYDGSRQSGTTGMGLFESIRIPNNVTKIGSLAFNNCTVLDNVNVPDSVVEIESQAFQECFGLETITIGTGIEYIGPRAFKECLALREVIFTGENLKSIGNAAFRECGNLETVNIPDGTTYVGRYAFYDCSSLSELEIPTSVKYIGKNAFLGTNLEILDIAGFTVEQVNEKADGWGIPKGCKVACSDGSTIIGEEGGKE